MPPKSTPHNRYELWAWGLMVALIIGFVGVAAFAEDHPVLRNVIQSCQQDAKTLCPDVKPGGGRILACLKQQSDKVSDGCKDALMAAQSAAAQAKQKGGQ
jgi:Cysteine rich repeat